MRTRDRAQRLDRLEARVGVRSTGEDGPGIDWSRLTADEQHDLSRLAGKTRRLLTGRWDFSALDDAELDQLRDLVAKGQAVLAQEPGVRRRG